MRFHAKRRDGLFSVSQLDGELGLSLTISEVKAATSDWGHGIMVEGELDFEAGNDDDQGTRRLLSHRSDNIFHRRQLAKKRRRKSKSKISYKAKGGWRRRLSAESGSLNSVSHPTHFGALLDADLGITISAVLPQEADDIEIDSEVFDNDLEDESARLLLGRRLAKRRKNRRVKTKIKSKTSSAGFRRQLLAAEKWTTKAPVGRRLDTVTEGAASVKVEENGAFEVHYTVPLGDLLDADDGSGEVYTDILAVSESFEDNSDEPMAILSSTTQFKSDLVDSGKNTSEGAFSHSVEPDNSFEIIVPQRVGSIDVDCTASLNTSGTSESVSIKVQEKSGTQVAGAKETIRNFKLKSSPTTGTQVVVPLSVEEDTKTSELDVAVNSETTRTDHVGNRSETRMSVKREQTGQLASSASKSPEVTFDIGRSAEDGVAVAFSATNGNQTTKIDIARVVIDDDGAVHFTNVTANVTIEGSERSQAMDAAPPVELKYSNAGGVECKLQKSGASSMTIDIGLDLGEGRQTQVSWDVPPIDERSTETREAIEVKAKISDSGTVTKSIQVEIVPTSSPTRAPTKSPTLAPTSKPLSSYLTEQSRFFCLTLGVTLHFRIPDTFPVAIYKNLREHLFGVRIRNSVP